MKANLSRLIILAVQIGFISLVFLESTIHVYPTVAEANRFAAGEWKKARTPGQKY